MKTYRHSEMENVQKKECGPQASITEMSFFSNLRILHIAIVKNSMSAMSVFKHVISKVYTFHETLGLPHIPHSLVFSLPFFCVLHDNCALHKKRIVGFT